MPRLLVTGGAGFIGSNFVHYWLREHSGDRVVVLDALTYAGNLSNLHLVQNKSNLRFIHGDIRDTALIERLLREEGIDTLVHFAAESHVDRSIHGPDAFVDTNIVGTHSLLKAARRVWLDEGPARPHRYHHVSTDEVYGSLTPQDPPFHEHTPYGLQVTTSNCSNNYGPHHFPEKLIPLTILNILAGRALPVYGDGRNVRDWLHVSDHCRGIDLILSRGTAGEVYNIGGGSECENLHLVHALCAIADDLFRQHATLATRYPQCPAARHEPASSLIHFVRDRPGHDRRYAIDCQKIQTELGYRANVSLEDGLRSTFNWYLQNEWWWKSVLDGSYEKWIEVQYGRPSTAAPSALQ